MKEISIKGAKYATRLSGRGFVATWGQAPRFTSKKNCPTCTESQTLHANQGIARRRAELFSNHRTSKGRLQSSAVEGPDLGPAKGNPRTLRQRKSLFLEPTPELAYVIGVNFGDGSLNRKGYNRRIRLQAIDLDFLLEFNRCLSKVLGTRRHTPWFDTKRREIHVEASSVLLHDFLAQDWENLKPWIEHCSSCVSMFLRGFCDSEGSVDEAGHVTCTNSDFGLLKFVRDLLSNHFGIETTGQYKGSKFDSKRRCKKSPINHLGKQKVARGVGFEPTRPEGHRLSR